MEDSEYLDVSEVEETEVLFMGLETQTSNSDSDVVGEVDPRDEVVSALEELDKSRKKNKQSNLIISQLEAQLLESQKVEKDVNLQLKQRIQEFEKLAKEITQFKRKLDEGSIKSKFENSSRILDDILSSQKPSNDKFGLGFVKEKKPENFPITNKKGGKKSYAEILKTPSKKEVNKKVGLIYHDENRNNMAPKIPNRYLHIFLGYCYSCNNFGHKALNCRTKRKESEYKKRPSSIKTKGNKIFFHYSNNMT